jgi:hypothetical protein
MNTVVKALSLAALLLPAGLYAEDGLRGHWTGALDLPDHSMALQVDLDKAEKGWIGSIAIPEQRSLLPLDQIAPAKGKWTFHIKGVPGDPTFVGTLSDDGKTITGDFTQGPGTFPFKLTRAGDPKVEVIKSSPAVAKEFVGTWEGALEAGQTLRLVMKMSNDDSGSKAVLISLDQGGSEIPVGSIEMSGTTLTLRVNAVGGEYQGDINKEGTEITGTWTQGGSSLPLKMKKAK